MGALVPPALPVSLDEVRAFLRIESDAEKALIAGLTRAAADLCEAFIGQALIVRAIEEELPAGGGGWRRLGTAPVRAITAAVGRPI